MTDGKTSKNNNNGAPVTFLRDHGHGPERLNALLARIDWTRADAFARAHDTLALFVATIAELLVADARARGQPLGVRLNALLDNSSPEERPLLGLAMHHVEGGSGAPVARAPKAARPLARLLPRHRTALTAAAATLPAHVRLLRDGTLPASRLPELVAVDTETLLHLLARQLLAERSPDAAVTLKLLKVAAQGEEQRGTLLRRARLVQKLLGDHLPPAALDYRSFRTLPAAMRGVLLFTPSLCRSLLDPQAQAAARPPSPDFDPLYLEHALSELQRGRLSHVELDTLFLAAMTPAFRARIVAALAEGSGELTCADDIRERLIAGAGIPELALVACAAARSPQDVRRAIAQLPGLPGKGVLGEALHGFAVIAWRDVAPAEVPAALCANAAFVRDMRNDSVSRLSAFLQGESTRLPAAALFRQLTGWLAHADTAAGSRNRKDAFLQEALAALLAQQGHRLAADIDGNDLCALYAAGAGGKQLAIALARRLREYNAARWEHGFFTRLVDIDPSIALSLVNNQLQGSEQEILQQSAAPQQHALPDTLGTGRKTNKPT